MKISFVVIAYNEEENIKNCISSILSQERLDDYEIIVVNDGSKDRTSGIVNNFAKINRKIKLIDLKENKGRGYARCSGVRNAKGDYIAFVDADIILSKNWVRKCMKKIREGFDATGGIAVPDGDAIYFHKTFKIEPKLLVHTTEITGSNGFYKKGLFSRTSFNSNMREGEDFDFNSRIKNQGYNLQRVENLIVKHNENKHYLSTLKWMYRSGFGATKLFLKHKKIRIPDLAFFGFFCLFLAAIMGSLVLKTHLLFLLFLIYPLLTSLLHVKSRFYFHLKKMRGFLLAVLANYPLIFSYYIGRIIGFLK